MSNVFTQYLALWNYDINNLEGNSCLVLNIIDAICLSGYIFIVVFTTWSVGIANLTYVATAILSFRTLLKFLIKQREVKKNKGQISVTYNTVLAVYLLMTAILIAFYFVVYYMSGGLGTAANLSLTIYYSVFFIVKITEIIVRCFDAKPHIYGK